MPQVAVDSMNPDADRKSWFHVRPAFLLGCATLLVILVLPSAIAHKYDVQWLFLLFASLAIALGWFLLAKYREPNGTWRALIALATSVYLTAFLPVFLFELAQIKWLMRHPFHHAFSMYVWPWVHWGYQGYLFAFLGVAGALMGRSWARIAFVSGSVLLLILRASMGTWVL